MARIICLANSYKHGGRCIAGIDIDTGRWIRPVPNTTNRAVTAAMRLIDGTEPEILDIIEIPLEMSGPDEGCQPENRLLKPGRWTRIGRITGHDLLKYCEDDSVILHNHQEYVVPEYFSQLPMYKWCSLQLVHSTIVGFRSAFKPNQWRVVFQYGKGHTLDLKLTDPFISEKLKRQETISTNCILTVSLATPWSPPYSNQPKRCYKMIAGIVEL
jgi:hypothetical protein